MKKIKPLFCFCILTTLGVVSCIKDEKMDSSFNSDYLKGNSNVEKTILGRKIEDPYNIKHMIEALAIMENEENDIPIHTLEPTGVYVRVLTHNGDEMDALLADSTIAWFDYPLDFEIVNPGAYYHDPDLSDENMSWEYAVLPLGYFLPENLNVDTLHLIFIPDEHPMYQQFQDFFDKLENISFKLCYGDSHSPKATKWTPSATITVYDDWKGIIPLQGVRIKAHNAGKTAWAITDANGNCTFETQFNDAVTYTIDWSRNHWRIVNSSGNNTYLNGPTQKSKWTKNIGTNEEIQLQRATIHRAALISNYGNNWTIQRPYSESVTSSYYKIRIKYLHYGNNDIVGAASCKTYSNSIDNLFSGDHIIIWGKDQYGTLFPTQKIFAGTLHELGHWSHRLLKGPNGFNSAGLFIKESWASCIAWKIATNHYQNCIYLPPTGYANGFQDWTSNTPQELHYYTPIFIDLIDNYNQHNGNSSYCNDNISGYTLKEIQDNVIDKDITNQASLYIWLYLSIGNHGQPVDVYNLVSFYDNNNF